MKANFEQILDPATQSQTDTGYLRPYYKSSRAVNPSTFELTLSSPYSALLPVLSQAFFGIESPKAMARGLEANCQSPVGTGPFIVRQWNRGQSVELDRNPEYNSAPQDAKHQGPAYLEHVSWKFLEDGSVRFAAVQGRDADIIFNPPPQQKAALEADRNLVLQAFTHTGLPERHRAEHHPQAVRRQGGTPGVHPRRQRRSRGPKRLPRRVRLGAGPAVVDDAVPARGSARLLHIRPGQGERPAGFRRAGPRAMPMATAPRTADG